MSRRVFLPHRRGSRVLFSERLTDARDSLTYAPLLEMDLKSGTIIARFSPEISERDIHRCRDLVAQMQRYEKAVAQAGACDFLALTDPEVFKADATSVSLQRLWSEYASQVLIYGQVAEAYLAQPPAQRLSAELSLDLYRKALSFHDLARAERFLEEDLPSLKTMRLSRHHCETIYDALFHLARRLGRRDMAFTCIERAWHAQPNVTRTEILIAEAAYFRRSKAVVQYARYLALRQNLSAIQLAQLAVAYARLGAVDQARQTVDRLRALSSEEAEQMARKVDAFLAAGSS